MNFVLNFTSHLDLLAVKVYIMLYIQYKPSDCPNMFAYPFLWYWCRYFYKLYKFIIWNYKSVKFGRFIEFFKLTMANIVHGFKLIDFEWNTIWKDKYESYLEIIK